MTRLIGLEISSTAVRMAKVSTTGRDHRLLAFAEATLSPGAVVDGSIVDRVAVLSAIGRCLAARGMRERFERALPVQLGVAGLRAITREIEMPVVPDAELDDAVRLQALDIIPFPVDKTLLSARRLAGTAGAPDDLGVEHTRVLLAAAHRDLVDPFVEVASAAGLVPGSVDLASSALVRALADPAGTGGPEVIISIGADLTTIVVHDGGRPLFVRTIGEGGNTVTKAIATALDMPLVDAEGLKRYIGVPERHIPAAALAAARDGSSRILAEIRSSIDYYGALPNSAPIRRVLLTGGASRLNGLSERLHQLVQVPVERASCLARVHGDQLGSELAGGGALDDIAAVAIGLALPEPAGTKRLDLLPVDFIVGRRLRRDARAIAAAAGVVVLALLAGGVLRFLQVHNAEQGIGSSRATITYLQAQIPKYDKVSQQHAALVADRALALPLVSYEVNWPAVLADLRRYTPKSISTSGFSGSATPAVATTSAQTGTAAVPDLLALPPSSDVLGTISLSYTGSQYPDFQAWFDAMTGSKRFQVLQFSGVTSTGSSITFSAQLNITGAIQTSRFAEYDFPKAAR